jgi:transposase-like protein
MNNNISYPTTQEEFEQRFHSEDACIDYLVSIRWPDGFNCPKCNNPKYWRSGTRLICSACKTHTRVLAGTIFQDTHTPLMVWFRVMWFIVNQKYGANAMGMHRLLGIPYKTAFHILHKLRRAMVRPGREKLSGTVEVDEAYFGGKAEGSPGRGADKKTLMGIAVEVKDDKLGRSRMKVLEKANADNLTTFIEENIEPGSTVVTDGWSGYSDKTLKNKGYKHIIDQPNQDREALPHVHLIISLIKRWLLGTYQGSFSAKNIAYYLDEYTFRFNRRTSKSRGKLFLRLMENAVKTSPVTWDEISLGTKLELDHLEQSSDSEQ